MFALAKPDRTCVSVLRSSEGERASLCQLDPNPPCNRAAESNQVKNCATHLRTHSHAAVPVQLHFRTYECCLPITLRDDIAGHGCSLEDAKIDGCTDRSCRPIATRVTHRTGC